MPARAQFTYAVNANQVTITGYTGPGGEVTIPDAIEGLPVTEVGDHAFSRNYSLTGVTIPDSLKTIGTSAFQTCNNLAKVSFGAAVQNIGSNAFLFCSRITELTIPDSTTRIGSLAFNGCNDISSLHLGQNLTSIGGGAFQFCFRVGSVAIPDSVTNLGAAVFSDCYALTNLTIGSGAIRIPDSAFQNCMNLVGFSIPDTVSTIGSQAFAGCSTITDVVISQNISEIESGAFADCRNLKVIGVDAANPDYSSADGVLFNRDQTILLQCPGGRVGEYIVPASILELEPGALAKCANLMTIGVEPGNPNFISNDGVMFSVDGTKLVQCPGGRTGDYNIPDGVTHVGESAFAGCASIQSVAIPDSVTVIGNQAFSYCSNLTSIVVPDGVSTIGSYAFFHCDKLMDIHFGNALTSIGESAFSYCTDLAKVLIPDSVKIIEQEAFAGCGGMVDATVGNGVNEMGLGVFSFCNNLARVYFLGNAPVLDAGTMFYGNNFATVYYLPGTTGWTDTFAGRPAVVWNPTASAFDVQRYRFSFTISGSSNLVVVVEASLDLSNPNWIPVSTNTLVDGKSEFVEPDWWSLPSRYYRFRSP